MKKTPLDNFKDISYFYKEIKNVKKIKQDTVFHEKSHQKNNQYAKKRDLCNQDAHIQFFNAHVPHKVIDKNPVSYVREKFLITELKKLQKKIYVPEICIDCHGLNQYQAQQELGKLIFTCYKERIFCFGVIHGHGKNILKNYIPVWLSKHPDVLAFYQAPIMFGKNTTLFVLMNYKK
ncbi:endonuclease SmrB [Buchnera aphidicola (Takecallis taiwana)]|uniref:endonuclease SmrB n=1 Tax=Buchnera aphidicola TaxID=9 RepID=UPI0031B684CA